MTVVLPRARMWMLMMALFVLFFSPAAALAGGGEPALPNFISLALETVPGLKDSHFGHFLHTYEYQIFMVLIVIIVLLALKIMARNDARVPNKKATFLEVFYLGFENFLTDILGKHNKKHVPFFGTLFLFIWSQNMFGLIPGFTGATSKFQTTFPLAIIVFFYIHYHGFKESRIKGYWDHMRGEPKGALSTVIGTVLIFPIELIGKIVQPVSLALRLFGNLTGEHILGGVFLLLGLMLAGAIMPHPPVGVPLHMPFLLFGLLVGTIQAMVFTMLSIIYLLLVLPHHHDEHEHEHADGHAKAH